MLDLYSVPGIGIIRLRCYGYNLSLRKQAPLFISVAKITIF